MPWQWLTLPDAPRVEKDDAWRANALDDALSQAIARL
jgi:hypothetical protein